MAARDRTEDQRPLYDALEAAAEHFARALRTAPRRWITSRAVASGEIARDYRLGYAEDRWDGLLAALKPRFEEKVLVEAGLAIRKEGGKVYDRFRGRIMFPIRDNRGRVTGFGGRILTQGEPKYLNSPETPVFHKGQQLYGLYEARQTNTRLERLLVVEGYMDVIALAQHGITHAVATLGTATTREHLERLFRVVPRLVFCFDGDAAGRKAAWRALEQALPVMRDGREAAFLFLRRARTRTAWCAGRGRGFRGPGSRGTGPDRCLPGRAAGRFDDTTREGRARLGTEAARLLKAMPEGLLKTQLVNDLARLCGLSPEQFSARTAPSATPENPPPDHHSSARAERPSPRRLTVTPVRLALSLLLQEPALAGRNQGLGFLRGSPLRGRICWPRSLKPWKAPPI
jgi:DNA primase